MKELLFFLIIILLLLSMSNGLDFSKVLIIYFTKTNNTKTMANYIKNVTGITDSYKIVPSIPYPEKYEETKAIANKEKEEDSRPEIVNPLTDISKYDTIFLGYPLWHNNIPNIVITQIEKLKWNGKTIYPFNTHGSSGIGESVEDIKKYAIGADVKNGFPISEAEIKSDDVAILDVKDWVYKTFENEEEEEEEDNDKNNNSLKDIKLNYFIYLIFIILL